MLSLKSLTSFTQMKTQFKKLPWWQQIVVLLVVLYVGKYVLDAFRVTSTIRALVEMKDNINALTSESFEGDDGASKGSRTLNCTMYYAPWCGHCKTSKPEWIKIEQELNGKTINGTTIVVTKIDCDEFPKVAEEQGIDGFPTFKFEMEGKYYEYNKGRTYNEFKQFINGIVQ